jgi:hypothetical protein
MSEKSGNKGLLSQHALTLQHLLYALRVVNGTPELESGVPWLRTVRAPRVVDTNDEGLVLGKWCVGRPAKVGDLAWLRKYGNHVVRRLRVEGQGHPKQAYIYHSICILLGIV